MADMAVHRVGSSEYRVYGLQARAEEIRGASRQISEATGGCVDAARAALEGWHGAHASAFVERADALSSSMVSFQLAVRDAASTCESWPGEATGSSYADQYTYQGAKLHWTDDDPTTSSANPSALRGYATAAGDQAGRFSSAAATVTTEGLTADVSVQRGLTADERQEQREAGTPNFEIEDMRVWGDPQPCPVSEVFGLPDLSAQAATLQSDTASLGAWVAAVAYAFETGDTGLQQLLLDHPEVAGYFADGLPTDGRMTGEAALALVLANIGMFDQAGGHGDRDGVVGLPDLEAIANDASMPAHLRDAARYLLENRLLLSMVSTIDDPYAFEVAPEADRLDADRITRFLEFNGHLNQVALHFDLLDIAAKGGDGDGYVSPEDLRAAAENGSLPPGLRDAATFLLANGMLTQRVQAYERANVSRLTHDVMATSQPLTDAVSGFNRNGVIALAIDQQAFSDPAEARRFVLDLPVADAYGHGGLPVTLVSDEGLKALANSALIDTRGDLGDAHAVIAHLPETTGWNGSRGAVEQDGGVRNTLINGFYDHLAHRADGLFAGDLAGHPEVPGHPGANWLMFAPWASNGVHGVITGDTTGPLGFTTSGIQQAAADGNQFIFNDIGGRYAAFIEMYEANPHPTETQLESFFSQNFDDGDGTIRDGFAAYVAAMDEDDPVHRQRLMFEANTLVATHEQAGVQPYLEDVSFGPDGVATRFVELQVGNDNLRVVNDVPPGPRDNNLVLDRPLLSFDTGGRTAESYSNEANRFRVGGDPSAGVVDMGTIRGHEAFQPDFSGSTSDWWRQGTGGGGGDPESLAGSNATSWPDWNERMNYILHLFEQNHTNPELFNTERIGVDLDNVEWLEAGARPRG